LFESPVGVGRAIEIEHLDPQGNRARPDRSIQQLERLSRHLAVEPDDGMSISSRFRLETLSSYIPERRVLS
jgi:hypothetical protein